MNITDHLANILLLISKLRLVGAQRVLHNHSMELANHSLTEAVINLEGGNLYPSNKPVVSLNVSGGGGTLAMLQNFRRRIRGLRQFRERLRPAFIISQLEGTYYVNLLSDCLGKKIVCVYESRLHDANIRGVVGWQRKNVLIPMLYNRADRIVTVSRVIIAEHIEESGVNLGKLLTINNFFEVAHMDARSREQSSSAQLTIYAGVPAFVISRWLTLQKKPGLIVRILLGVAALAVVHAFLWADGELCDVLTGWARELGLRMYTAWECTCQLAHGHDVDFLGLQQNPFMYLRSATAFVFPSSWDSFLMALEGSMICGMPVLSTGCPDGPRGCRRRIRRRQLRPSATPSVGSTGRCYPCSSYPVHWLPTKLFGLMS